MSKNALERNCETCGDSFLFTIAEQENYAKKTWSPPRRCEGCRDARRRVREGTPEQAEGFEAVCSACGTLTYLKFRPDTDRPVYCGPCFKNR